MPTSNNNGNIKDTDIIWQTTKLKPCWFPLLVKKNANVFHFLMNKRNYYTILYYTILYYTILYYTILYYTILYYTILYYTILYYTILYYTILYYTILYYTILYYTILYYTILYYTILYYTILYYTILYYTILSWNVLNAFDPEKLEVKVSGFTSIGKIILFFLINISHLSYKRVCFTEKRQGQ